MGDIHETPPRTAESKNVLPDVVHPQQIPAEGTAVTDAEVRIDTQINETGTPNINEDDSHTESISEHIPSKMEYSLTESDIAGASQSGLLQVEQPDTDLSRNSSLNIHLQSPSDNPSTQDPSKSSWPIPKSTENYNISEESPVNLASESISKDTHETQAELEKPKVAGPQESPRSDKYLDSLNDETSNPSEDEKDSEKHSHSSVSPPLSLSGEDSLKRESSGSEEIIKLDIRGQGAPRYPLSAAKIIFGPPPEGSTLVEENIQPLPVFQTLLSPFLVGAGEMKVEELFTEKIESQEAEMEKDSLSSDKIEQSDLLVEEVTVDYDTKEKAQDESLPSMPQPKSMADTLSFSTMTTDYKTICEEFQAKLVHLESAITKRDALIEELTVTLQRSIRERDALALDNQHLTREVVHLQRGDSEHDTIKAQLSDYAKYESMIKDDTKFYSALMSSGSSSKSSNGEKDNDREEMTVNYSKSDLKSDSDDFQGIETKLQEIISRFDESIEENLRNKLRESLIQVLCDEIARIRIESDTDVKELETQLRQDKHAFTVETRRLRELLASVKAGNADIDELREELAQKHEKEMENLRTYFEKKCSDMERSYSEEVYRGRACASPQSASSLEPPNEAGDCLRRRTRSADLPSLTNEMPPLQFAIKQANRPADIQQLEDLKAEHAALVREMQDQHRLTVSALQEQISQLKAHVQTAENTESNVSLYQQDIDLELEKDAIFEKRLEEAKQEVIHQLQEQIQVLLSDPDAELSSWPLELVALRDKIHDARPEKELSSLRDEVGEADKWKQRRHTTFDQNRHLEEITRERDSFKRVATSLQRIVGQLVAYCAAAEDELNRTVLGELLARLLPETSLVEESRPSTPRLDVSVARSKHVHFAPDLSLLAELGSEGVAGFLQGQRDVSADIKRELELSLRRLREEAQVLLETAARVKGKVPTEPHMLECSQVHITELVEKLDSRHAGCENCELHRKNMEEAMTECLQRENLLRSDLEAALMKVAELMQTERTSSCDIVVEGYGTGQHHQTPASLPVRAPPRRQDSGPASLDACSSPRVLKASYDALYRERDDLQQQLEAANRQLRSTRSFVEEQAAEREAERDEFARRLDAMRDENNRLTTRLQTNATILNEMLNLRITCCDCQEHYAQVEQLEAQTRDMNALIQELESRKAAADEELKATNEKISLLRDIIAGLEGQLEQKTAHEAAILDQLEEMRKTIDERDSRMRGLLGELESLRSERAELSSAVSAADTDDRAEELMERIKEQSRWLEEKLHRRTRRLERAHETCSATLSEPSEDVSLRDRQNPREAVSPPPSEASPRWAGVPELLGVFEAVEALSRAEDAALKRIADLDMQRAQLTDVAQEVRAERDVLQARMSEQALKISSLSARLETQRNNAEVLAHQAAHQLTVSLHDALAEVQRLKEELESKDKQLLRAKQNLEEKEKLNERHQTLYGNSCNPKDKVVILERELSAAQTRIAQLEALAKSLERDKDELQARLRDHRRALAEREEQLQEIMALKLDEEQKEDEPEGKTSARTLSDIVSISEFDEQDLQMRRAELKAQNLSLTGVPYVDNRDRTQNRTLPPDMSKPNMSSLNLDFIDHFDLPSFTPRAESLPGHLTSTQNKDRLFKRNVNETTVFGTAEKFGDSVKHSTAQNIPDNCSMYPNREIDESKDVSVAPKKIDFSAEPSRDNRSQDDEFTSLRELGITFDVRQENFPDILTQLKHEIKKSRTELDTCKSELKNAEEQLCEFPALKEEVEELKGLLENTMATMENDKKFYENQLEHFSSNKTLLEQRVSELMSEVNEKSKDLHLLKEDILRRENMILELAKEKRNLTNKITELEVKIDEIQSRNTSLEKCETENRIMKEKLSELEKLEQLVSEKNQQIDSLNQHLDRLDDLQRRLNDKTEELDNLKEAFEEKSNEIFRQQDTIDAQNRDIEKINEENNNLNLGNKELKLKLSKLEKEQENASIKLQNSESELERVNSLNNELTSKIDELKDLTDKLKDKETEIDILNEDINSYHEEIASLKEQMKMVSRSPSPKSKTEKTDRQASNDKKQLAKIRKQISLLQHELDFNRKELNDKAFELAKAKLDVTELRNSLSQATKQGADCEEHRRRAEAAEAERDTLEQRLQAVTERLREESNISELQMKLEEKTEKCQELEAELQDMKDLVDRLRDTAHQSPVEERALVVSGTRSPTAELERALRDQLDYSHRLDQDIMDQILSASSDEHEDIPRLALNSSKSSSSMHSTSSERVGRLKSENDRLALQVANLEARLQDKDALITELNRIRDKLVQDWQAAKLRLQAEKDNCGRLQLLLLTHKESAETMQNQDSSMIQILKKRLESAMKSELELQQREMEHKARLAALERQLVPSADEPSAKLLQAEQENSERLRGEISLLKSKLEAERTRVGDTQALLEHSKTHFQRELDAKSEQCHSLRTELAELRRLKHDLGVELVRSKELLNIQSGAVAELEHKLKAQAQAHSRRPLDDALTEIESHKTELAREITNLRVLVGSPELSSLRDARTELAARAHALQTELAARTQGTEEKDQAIRYLHNRCLRLESCRKALVWQKRYLQRVLAGYEELERGLRLPRAPERSAGKKRFKCVAWCVVVVLRMRFLVRRRAQLRALSAAAILRPRHDPDTTPATKAAESTPRGRVEAGADAEARARTRPRDALARRVLDPDRTLQSPATPQLGDFIRRSYSSNSQLDDSFGISSPRGAAYLDKLGLVSRCLSRAMDAARDVP